MSSLAMDKAITLYVTLDRPYLTLHVFDYFVHMLNDPDAECPKTVVYCNNLDIVSDVYLYNVFLTLVLDGATRKRWYYHWWVKRHFKKKKRNCVHKI